MQTTVNSSNWHATKMMLLNTVTVSCLSFHRSHLVFSLHGNHLVFADTECVENSDECGQICSNKNGRCFCHHILLFTAGIVFVSS